MLKTIKVGVDMYCTKYKMILQSDFFVQIFWSFLYFRETLPGNIAEVIFIGEVLPRKVKWNSNLLSQFTVKDLALHQKIGK
jgi:hypothetical protein